MRSIGKLLFISCLWIAECQLLQYYFNEDKLIYTTAASRCVDRGMVLAQPKTQVLWNQLSDFLSPLGLGGGDSDMWIGLSYDSNWIWADGDAMTWSMWASDEPDNIDEETCALTDHAKTEWLNDECSRDYTSVCQSTTATPTTERETTISDTSTTTGAVLSTTNTVAITSTQMTTLTMGLETTEKTATTTLDNTEVTSITTSASTTFSETDTSLGFETIPMSTQQPTATTVVTTVDNTEVTYVLTNATTTLSDTTSLESETTPTSTEQHTETSVITTLDNTELTYVLTNATTTLSETTSLESETTTTSTEQHTETTATITLDTTEVTTTLPSAATTLSDAYISITSGNDGKSETTQLTTINMESMTNLSTANYRTDSTLALDSTAMITQGSSSADALFSWSATGFTPTTSTSNDDGTSEISSLTTLPATESTTKYQTVTANNTTPHSSLIDGYRSTDYQSKEAPNSHTNAAELSSTNVSEPQPNYIMSTSSSLNALYCSCSYNVIPIETLQKMDIEIKESINKFKEKMRLTRDDDQRLSTKGVAATVAVILCVVFGGITISDLLAIITSIRERHALYEQIT